MIVRRHLLRPPGNGGDGRSAAFTDDSTCTWRLTAGDLRKARAALNSDNPDPHLSPQGSGG
jgi:hypothetical protein